MILILRIILEEKNNANKVTEKATETIKVDDTASKKAFGQYGSTPMITSLIIITSILGCFGYKKFKKTMYFCIYERDRSRCGGDTPGRPHLRHSAGIRRVQGLVGVPGR